MRFDVSSKTCSTAFGAQLAQPASVVSLDPLLREAALVVVSEDVDELEHDLLPFGGRGPIGECVNSRTNVPVIVVWQAT